SGNRLRQDGGAQRGAPGPPRRARRPRLSGAGGRVAQGISRHAARRRGRWGAGVRNGRRRRPGRRAWRALAPGARRRGDARRAGSRDRGGAGMRDLVLGFRWQDGVDIVLLAIGIYSGINLIRGTRAVPMLIGLSMVYGLYFLSAQFEIYTVNVLLN